MIAPLRLAYRYAWAASISRVSGSHYVRAQRVFACSRPDLAVVWGSCGTTLRPPAVFMGDTGMSLALGGAWGAIRGRTTRTRYWPLSVVCSGRKPFGVIQVLYFSHGKRVFLMAPILTTTRKGLGRAEIVIRFLDLSVVLAMIGLGERQGFAKAGIGIDENGRRAAGMWAFCFGRGSGPPAAWPLPPEFILAK